MISTEIYAPLIRFICLCCVSLQHRLQEPLAHLRSQGPCLHKAQVIWLYRFRLGSVQIPTIRALDLTLLC